MKINSNLPLFYCFLSEIKNEELKELNINRRFGKSKAHDAKRYIKKISFKPITVLYL